MATSKNQRLGIMAILVVTVVGTIGSFAVMVLSSQNQATESAAQQETLNAYQASSKAYQAKVDAQAAQLSAQYFATFSPQASRVGAFDANAVKAIAIEDLVIGTGEDITGTTKFAAYYIGWNPKGKIFDQSIDMSKLKAPIPIADGLDNASLISGWKEALKGMKIGGIREITLPSDKAYGEKGSGDTIPPNTPLKFIVMAIPLPQQIPQPEVPASLYQGAQ
ncbi:FKBP-type peptidyl-prolyl cis-trans isomerase [Microbacteriaceae bacterium]|nr:FKBP-type peptidyl-prolyl cis-trans isomerase [Candidatus Saccharibacteria bacterium]